MNGGQIRLAGPGRGRRQSERQITETEWRASEWVVVPTAYRNGLLIKCSPRPVGSKVLREQNPERLAGDVLARIAGGGARRRSSDAAKVLHEPSAIILT